ncbi:MAG TPA: hypothetical protein VFB81_05515 [Myxococcales bacterium]|nr:hypothetical protein [Myxococcales bacterium]
MIGLALVLALSAAPTAPWRGVYPGAHLVPIGGEATVLGQPQRLAYFTTTDEPDAVAGYYARRWRAQGFPAVAQREPSRRAVVAAALSTRDGTLVAVVADRVAPGRTLVFLVVRSLWSAGRGGESAR